MNKTFLKQLKYYLQQLENQADTAGLISSLAEYLFSHQSLLDDSAQTVNFINILSLWLEGQQSDLTDFILAFYQFWLHCIQQAGIELFYIGNLDNLKKLALSLNGSALSQVCFLSGSQTDPQEIDHYFKRIAQSPAAFLVYDPEGLKIMLAADCQHTIGVVSFYDLMLDNAIPVSDVINPYAHFLTKQYCLLANPHIRTAIIGNSYGYYGFPQQITDNAVNLSMHSFSIRQAQVLTEYIIRHYPHVKQYVFCFGYFDLYSDLFKTKDAFNQQIITAFSQFTSHYKINRCARSLTDDTALLSRLVVHKKQHTGLEDKLNNLSLREQIWNSAQKLFTEESYLPKEQQNQTARARAISHSRSIKHTLTLEENQQIVHQLKMQVKQAGKKIVWVTPPFPEAYVQNITDGMKIMNRTFLTQQNDREFSFIDLSASKSFRRHDFRDGDHLNFAGARKLVNKLRKMDVPL